MKIPKNKYTKQFLRFVKSKCKEYNVKFTIVDNNILDDNRDLTGYFTDEKGHKELLISAPNQYILVSTLVHEFSHMLQWINQSTFYTARIRGGIDPYLIMIEWLSGKTYQKKTVKASINKVRLCELDCDRNALLLIDEFNLPINKLDYIYDAIAYQYFLKYVEIKRNWIFNGKAVTGIDLKDIVDPSLDNNFDKLPKKIRVIFEQILT